MGGWVPTDPGLAELLVDALDAEVRRRGHEGRGVLVEAVELLSACRLVASSSDRSRPQPPTSPRGVLSAGCDAQHAGAHLLDLDEAAVRLSTSRRTVERLVKGGALPSVRLTALAVRVHSDDLEDFMNGLREKNRKAAAS